MDLVDIEFGKNITNGRIPPTQNTINPFNCSDDCNGNCFQYPYIKCQDVYGYKQVLPNDRCLRRVLIHISNRMHHKNNMTCVFEARSLYICKNNVRRFNVEIIRDTKTGCLLLNVRRMYNDVNFKEWYDTNKTVENALTDYEGVYVVLFPFPPKEEFLDDMLEDLPEIYVPM